MSAPLTGAALDVLRALVLVLELHKSRDGWRFVGPWQDPEVSAISAETIDPLLDGGYVREDADQGRITNDGRAVVAVAEQSLWESGVKWLRSQESQLSTY